MHESSSVWLETADGKRIDVIGNCLIGRSKSNRVVLSDARVSRRHTLIHAQGDDEYWIVDFGSVNGTRVNGRRLAQPSALKDQDEIEIADVRFRFHQTAAAANGDEGETGTIEATAVTAREIRTLNAWLLVADIVGSTRLTHSLSPEELPVVLGRWFSSCSEILEKQRGCINKFLGDGFFAFWPEPPDAAPQIAAALTQLRAAQQARNPDFRVVLHYGPVSSAGSQKTGEETLVGNQVHFVFRMEKLAGALNQGLLLSEPASTKLQPLVPSTPAGQYPLSGFDNKYNFFTLL